MQYNDQARLDPSQMGSSRGTGGKVAVGGGVGLIVMILAMLFGFNPGYLLGSAPAPGGGQQTQDDRFAHCQSGADISKDRDCRFVAYTNSIQSFWSQALSGYQPTKTNIFTGQVQTACGVATSQVGPFYCPGDATVYLDTGFFDQLQSQLGAQGGDAAEAYVIAHEYGHHIQNQIGVLNRIQQGGSGDGSAAVRSELQADCFAGVWFANASRDPNGPIAEITQQDMLEARAAAEAIGDDNIQENTTGRVDRESWTHGSSEQREKWLLIGYETGDPNQCDTWSARDLG